MKQKDRMPEGIRFFAGKKQAAFHSFSCGLLFFLCILIL